MSISLCCTTVALLCFKSFQIHTHHTYPSVRLWAIWGWDWLQTHRTINHAMMKWWNRRLLKVSLYRLVIWYTGTLYFRSVCYIHSWFNAIQSCYVLSCTIHSLIENSEHRNFLLSLMLLCGFFNCITVHKCVSPSLNWQITDLVGVGDQS